MKRKKSKAISGFVASILIVTTLLLPMALFTACAGEVAIEFEDISSSDWYYSYVMAGIRFGFITGDGGESLRFEPDRYVTQGEFITMLGRLHEYGHEAIGAPGDDPFYERYVEWALEMEIIHEYKYWDLRPYDFITREQKAVIVYRYIDVFDLHGYFLHEFFIAEGEFWDADDMSNWAITRIERFRAHLKVYGIGEFYFRPHSLANRADTVAIISAVGFAVYDLVHPLRG